LIKSKRTTGHRVAMTTLSVAGIGFIAAATLFTLNNGGRPNWTLGPRRKRVPRNADTPNQQKHATAKEKAPKLPKKYKVNADAKKWEETRKALYYYII
jgi:hypothetical protein